MKYIEFVNNIIKNEVSKHEKLVLFGQNIAAGSCLGGLTRGYPIPPNGKIINSTNSENSLCGFGFGMMMNGTSSVFFMKQLDFLLLSIDHLVNTFNIIRNHENTASFTVFPIVVDNGFQGPQSSFNSFGDFCSIARIDGYTITNSIDAEKIIQSKLVTSGFRIIAVSQRLFKEEIIEPEKLIYVNDNLDVFQYDEGNDVTVVCFNFSFPYGKKIVEKLKEKNFSCSLFNVNSPSLANWSKIISDVSKTKKLIVVDDSKSANLNCYHLISDVTEHVQLDKKIVLTRKIDDSKWLIPVDDQMEINFEEIVNNITNS
ncbi:pyruvate dehydrogenase E1 component subunit beta protein [Marine Group I thaumarchaeote SCGC AAA799-B03]|uniref:Pyruvate dehydrogenase E1 component subunit beta protein n=1 Tax=Marine Group I thaumarchaeote SCGC AAA799-B03 TaxID=1502289 RepID=A0A087S8U1_9ARCH|nr:pyruvate dehydrogenase E1 component subunit beta protein [Marine Group I thaumarchaeote SCGC AAA799-B03]